jgi:hypothetical protein
MSTACAIANALKPHGRSQQHRSLHTIKSGTATTTSVRSRRERPTNPNKACERTHFVASEPASQHRAKNKMIVPSDRVVWQRKRSPDGNLGIEFLELRTAVVYRVGNVIERMAAQPGWHGYRVRIDFDTLILFAVAIHLGER